MVEEFEVSREVREVENVPLGMHIYLSLKNNIDILINRCV